MSELQSKLREHDADVSGDDWDRWAREVYASVSDGDYFAESAPELRDILNEMILASVGKANIVGKLDSLRRQKRFLTSGVPLEYSARPMSFRTILIVAMSSRRLLKRATSRTVVLRKK